MVTRPDGAAVVRERRRAGRMTASAAMRRTGQLAGSDALTDADAVLLAVLLQDEERFVEVLTRLRTTSAERYWSRLVRVRAICPADAEPNVLALLAVASWLSGRGRPRRPASSS
ncbi:hypothetical protein G7085_01590 [Tessaracoccus sp. HDW20]|uniref:hypothetical protein n=1 Tax=Tessaracoccus coleopterorum TaxID=2714950 RepID=UPI0018D4C303|nr:hypothetical protein [Tessaracoccus coleopterorum]NHB83824.1 hypothetical protein [Tessaracoccus coleopterorum]